jgi:hypothetical protein
MLPCHYKGRARSGKIIILVNNTNSSLTFKRTVCAMPTPIHGFVHFSAFSVEQVSQDIYYSKIVLNSSIGGTT